MNSNIATIDLDFVTNITHKIVAMIDAKHQTQIKAITTEIQTKLQDIVDHDIIHMSPITLNTEFIGISNLVRQLVYLTDFQAGAEELALDLEIGFNDIIAEICSKKE